MRSTKTIALVLVGVLALFLGLGRALVMADQPDRATPTPYAPPEGLDSQGDAPASPDALPDLVVTHVNVFPTTPVVSQTVVIQVAIKNQGELTHRSPRSRALILVRQLILGVCNPGMWTMGTCGR